jgi:Tfp pilus assembly protein PilF
LVATTVLGLARVYKPVVFLAVIVSLFACASQPQTEASTTSLLPGNASSQRSDVRAAPVDRLIARALEHYDLQQYPQGQQLLERAIRLAPRNGEAWHLMALGYYEQGKFDKAMHFAKRASDFLPQNSAYQSSNQIILMNAQH